MPQEPNTTDTYLEWELTPDQGSWDTSNHHRWETVCGRYRVYRMLSKFCRDFNSNKTHPDKFGVVHRVDLGDSPSWQAIDFNPRLGSGYPKYYGSLALALDAVEEFHKEQTGCDAVTSNKDKLLAKAQSQNLDSLPIRSISPSLAATNEGEGSNSSRKGRVGETGSSTVLGGLGSRGGRGRRRKDGQFLKDWGPNPTGGKGAESVLVFKLIFLGKGKIPELMQESGLSNIGKTGEPL